MLGYSVFYVAYWGGTFFPGQDQKNMTLEQEKVQELYRRAAIQLIILIKLQKPVTRVCMSVFLFQKCLPASHPT